jgi:hypothetical protein
MRGLSLFAFLTGVLSLLVAPTASADPVYLEVRANSTANVAALPSWDAQCRFNGYPRVLVRGKPKHGQISVRNVSRVDIPANAGACAGKVVAGTVITYTPNRNYRGQDTAVLIVYAPKGGTFFRADVILTIQ